MMIARIITWPIVRKPVCSFCRRPQHMQLRVMCSDDRAFHSRVGRAHTMNQSLRNMCAAVERYEHKSDGALAIGDYESFFGVRKSLAAQRLQHGFELLCLEGRTRLGSCRICVEHLNTAHVKRSWPEVRQMQLVHHIEMRSAWECCGLERYTHFEL